MLRFDLNNIVRMITQTQTCGIKREQFKVSSHQMVMSLMVLLLNAKCCRSLHHSILEQ
jgi:hypothetical protein